jgi:hypothetical protein
LFAILDGGSTTNVSAAILTANSCELVEIIAGEAVKMILQ